MISAMNKNAKLITSLSKKKYRNEKGLFVVEGYRFVSEIPKDAEVVFYAVSEDFFAENKDFPYMDDVEKYIYSKSIFDKFSDTVSPQGILAVCRQLTYDYQTIINSAKNDLFLLLEGIRDPGNLGTIIRTAEAAGVKAVFLSKDTVDIYNLKVLRSTMGAIFHIAVFPEADILETIYKLKEKQIRIVGTSLLTEKNYADESYTGNTAVVIGSEADGISDGVRDLCDSLVKIPIRGRAESLNVAIAAGIVIYEAIRNKK